MDIGPFLEGQIVRVIAESQYKGELATVIMPQNDEDMISIVFNDPEIKVTGDYWLAYEYELEHVVHEEGVIYNEFNPPVD